MIDLQMLRNHENKVREGLGKRKVDSEKINLIIQLDQQKRAFRRETEILQAELNQASKKMGELIRNGHSAEDLKQSLKGLSNKIQDKEKDLAQLEELLQSMMYEIPNLPDDSVPEGLGESDNIEIRRVGVLPDFNFTPRSHDELGKLNDMLDFERGVKLAGNKFIVLKKDASYYSRSLMNLMLDTAIERGYWEISPPFVCLGSSLVGTGQLPKFEEDLYKIENEDLYLVPTGEVPLVNLFRDEVFLEDQLPLKVTAYTPCFRKEAGAAGKESKGLIRLHQFDKVELVCFSHPEKSFDMLENLTLDAEAVLQKLKLPYRVMLLCTGDMSGFSTSKTYDIEVWFPSLNKYVEISSCSNCTDFQARRAQIRYKDQQGKNHLLHTLNGSGLAIGRCLAALMENCQRADGSIAWPDVLK